MRGAGTFLVGYRIQLQHRWSWTVLHFANQISLGVSVKGNLTSPVSVCLHNSRKINPTATICSGVSNRGEQTRVVYT